MQRHNAYLATRTQVAVLRAVLKAEYAEAGRGGGHRLLEAPAGTGGMRVTGQEKTRRGDRKATASGELDSDASGSDKEGDRKKPKSTGRCAWPEKPRLPDDEFKEYRAECRKTCPDACFAILVGTCWGASCTRSYEAPTYSVRRSQEELSLTHPLAKAPSRPD